MSRSQVRWRDVERYFQRHGYVIRHDGGDTIIQAPKNQSTTRLRQQVRIGHRFCRSANTVLSKGHLAQIKRSFGVTADQILAG